jgi:hypothetical protein
MFQSIYAAGIMTKITTILITLAIASQALAGSHLFDRDRRGFIAGFDIGPGFTRISSTNVDLKGTVTKGTVGFTYRIGYAPDRHWQIYYSHRSSVYANKIWEHYQHIVIGVGSRYYAKESGQSWFFDGGIGFSDIADPYELEVPSAHPKNCHEGWGVFGGVGYEFARHVGVALQVHWSRAEASVTGALVARRGEGRSAAAPMVGAVDDVRHQHHGVLETLHRHPRSIHHACAWSLTSSATLSSREYRPG